MVHGLQGSPADLVRNANTPPTISYFIDYDDKFDDPAARGHIGSVRVYTTPCAPAAYVRPVTTATPISVPGGCVGPNCGNVCTPTCMCPPGTVLEGKECVRIRTDVSCKPPLVLDPLTGKCVPPKHECVPPLVLDPVTGACVCPQGTVMQDGKCVPQICPPPLVPGPCECPDGTVQEDGSCVRVGKIIVKKEVTTRNTQIPWPNPGPLFPMTLTCIAPPQSWSFSLNNNGTYTANNIPFGKTCTVAETALPAFPPNLCPRGLVPVWTPLPFTTPASVLINGTTVTMIVHNTVTCEKPGELTVTKKVSPDPRSLWNTLIFPMTVTCTNPPAPPFSYPLNVNGNTSTVPHSVPVGYHCVVAETLPALPKGCTWLLPIFSPPSGVTIHSGLNQETVTNGYTCSDGKIDVGIKKTGGTTPACAAPYYSFDITVTNVGASWPASGNVVVHDIVPNGMTFVTPAGCVPSGSIPAGTPFTCTYTGPAPGVGQALPVFNIQATATGPAPFPPFTNNATVSIPSSSGYVDSNAANNSATVTVTKPAACCTPPAFLNSDGICTCMPPQVLQYSNGGLAATCVNPPAPPPVCPLPQVPGPVAGTCICPNSEVLVDRKCVPKIVCDRPLVPDAAGTECVCPDGEGAAQRQMRREGEAEAEAREIVQARLRLEWRHVRQA